MDHQVAKSQFVKEQRKAEGVQLCGLNKTSSPLPITTPTAGQQSESQLKISKTETHQSAKSKGRRRRGKNVHMRTSQPSTAQNSADHADSALNNPALNIPAEISLADDGAALNKSDQDIPVKPLSEQFTQLELKPDYLKETLTNPTKSRVEQTSSKHNRQEQAIIELIVEHICEVQPSSGCIIPEDPSLELISPEQPSQEQPSMEPPHTENPIPEQSSAEESGLECPTSTQSSTENPIPNQPSSDRNSPAKDETTSNSSVQNTPTKTGSYQDIPLKKSQSQKIPVPQNAREKNPEKPISEDACSAQKSPVYITTPTTGQHSESQPTISEAEKHQPEKSKGIRRRGNNVHTRTSQPSIAQNSAEQPTPEGMRPDGTRISRQGLFESSTMNLNQEAQELIPRETYAADIILTTGNLNPEAQEFIPQETYAAEAIFTTENLYLEAQEFIPQETYAANIFLTTGNLNPEAQEFIPQETYAADIFLTTGNLNPEAQEFIPQETYAAEAILTTKVVGQKSALNKQKKDIAQVARPCHFCYILHSPFECPAMFWVCDQCGERGHSYYVCDERSRNEATALKKQEERLACVARRCHLCYVKHSPLLCPAMFWKCHHCGEEGHSYYVCNVRSPEKRQKRRASHRQPGPAKNVPHRKNPAWNRPA